MLSNLPIQHPIKKKRLLAPGQIAIFDHEIRTIQRQKNMNKETLQSPQKPPVPEKEHKWQQFALLALLLIFSSVWTCT